MSTIAIIFTIFGCYRIIQINIQCENLEIELISQGNGKGHYIKYEQGAFAAIELQPGAYTFGDVVCNSEGDEQRFDLLKGEQKLPEFK